MTAVLLLCEIDREVRLISRVISSPSRPISPSERNRGGVVRSRMMYVVYIHLFTPQHVSGNPSRFNAANLTPARPVSWSRPRQLSNQLLVQETEELLAASLSAMRANLEQNPAWEGGPPPTDDFLLMFLRTELFSSSAAADRYRKFWKVRACCC